MAGGLRGCQTLRVEGFGFLGFRVGLGLGACRVLTSVGRQNSPSGVQNVNHGKLPLRHTTPNINSLAPAFFPGFGA